jgi:hypothetical protein
MLMRIAIGVAACVFSGSVSAGFTKIVECPEVDCITRCIGPAGAVVAEGNDIKMLEIFDSDGNLSDLHIETDGKTIVLERGSTCVSQFPAHRVGGPFIPSGLEQSGTQPAARKKKLLLQPIDSQSR